MVNVSRPAQPLIQRAPLPIYRADYGYLKPLSHRIWFGITQLSTVLHHKSNPQKWHGKVVLLLAKGISRTGYSLNMAIQAIQFVALFIFSIAAIAFYYTFKERKLSNFFIKFAYYGENFKEIFHIQKSLLKENIFLSKFAQNAYLNHHIQLDICIRENLGLDEEFQPGVDETERVLNFFSRIAPKICQDVVEAAAKDLSLHHIRYVNNEGFFNFIRQKGFGINEIAPRHSIKAAMILLNQYLLQEMSNNLNINQQQALELLKGNINISNHPILRPQEVELNHIVLRVRPEDIQILDGQDEKDKIFKSYQNKLKNFIIDAYIDLNDQSELLRMLSLEKEKDAALIDGRERLENSLAIPQLANYATLKEIEKELEYPELLAEELHKNDNRYQLLKEAQEILLQLSAPELQILTNKLLKLGSYDIHEQGIDKPRAELLQKLFNKIGELAKPLYLGKLLIQEYVGVKMLREDRMHEVYDAQNLFQSACNEAQAKIEARK